MLVFTLLTGLIAGNPTSYYVAWASHLPLPNLCPQRQNERIEHTHHNGILLMIKEDYIDNIY